MMIVFILLLALVLRLVNLNQSLWLDEAVQAITAKESFSYIFQEITGDFHPPLYHFLLHFWVRIFGISEIALRMPSVLFGLGTVWMVYKISNLSALFLATAPFHIYYSQEARMYSMAAFFTTLSMYFFINLEKSRKNNILYYLATVLMVYSDYYVFFVLLAQMIYLLIKKKYKFLILNSIFLILSYLPWLPMLISQIKTGILATQTLPGWARLVNVSFLKAVPLTFVKFTIGRITIFDKQIYAAVSAFIIIAVVTLIIKGFIKNNKLLITNYQLLVFLWFFVPLLLSWLFSLFVPNFQPFRLLLILPAFYLLITGGIERLDKKRLRLLFSGIFLAINLISLSVYYTNSYFWREDWRGLVEYFSQQNQPKIVLPSSASNWPIRYYDKNKNIDLITGVSGVAKLDNSFEIDAKKKEKVYYIRYLVEVFDPQEKILAELKDEGFIKIDELSFNQLFVLKFEKR